MESKNDFSILNLKNPVTISTDEYADLLSARTRLDVICDWAVMQKYSIDKTELLILARGAPQLLSIPKEEIETDMSTVSEEVFKMEPGVAMVSD